MSKFHNVPTVMDGIKFHSKGEAYRYLELKLAQEAGAISGLRRQVRYRLNVEDVKICDYFADFVYTENGAEVVEDFKGVRTAEYKLKAKLMRALYGITILETSA